MSYEIKSQFFITFVLFLIPPTLTINLSIEKRREKNKNIKQELITKTQEYKGS